MSNVLILVEGQTEETFIIRVFPSYRKTVHGPLIIRRIGLEKIRKQCEHLNHWVSTLEKLG